MGVFNKAKTLFGSKSSEKLSNEVENLKKEVATQKVLLENSVNAIPDTFPSSSASKEKIIEDDNSSKLRRVLVKKLQHLYISNQFIFRGVNIRADELVSRGYQILGDDEKGVKACEELIKRSGDASLFKGLSISADVSGDGYIEKVYNDSHSKLMLLKPINSLTFGYLTDTAGNIILNDSKEPESFMQIYYEDSVEKKKEIDKKRIEHLIFNNFSDEFNGISTLQPVYNTALRLMNMENAAAEAAVKTANPLLVGTTDTRSPKDLAKWTKVLGNISSKEQVFLPQGVTLSLLSPGSQNFSKYSDYFLDAVVCALGTPKSILTGTSGSSSGNRATVSIQSRHFYSIIRSNQRIVEKIFNRIFLEYGEVAGFKAPVLVFEDIAEDAEITGQRAMELYQAGMITIEEAREMIGLDTSERTLKELVAIEAKKVNPTAGTDKIEKDEDMKNWHPAEPGSSAGSQKNIKKKQHTDPNVPSA